MENKVEKFKFYVPTTLIKGSKETENGTQEVYKFKGLASNGRRDLDGETMKDCDFEVIDNASINWNHKSDPEFTLGMMTDHKKKRGELEIEGELYPELKKAKATIELMEAMEKRGKHLGLSIEGQVLERDLINRKSIRKAKITAVALCLVPKNGATYAKLCKAFEDGKTIFQEEETLEYDKVTEDLVKFVSENGSELIVKSDGSVEFDVRLTEHEKHFITLVKAYQENMLNEKQQEDLENFYKNFVVLK